MLAYLRTITIGLLTLLAISSATIVRRWPARVTSLIGVIVLFPRRLLGPPLSRSMRDVAGEHPNLLGGALVPREESSRR